MPNEPRIEFCVRVQCELSDRGDGVWWNILEVVDDDGFCLGDCGVYEYNAEEGFPDGVTEYVLDVLDKLGKCDDDSAGYTLDIQLLEGRSSLGRSVTWFTKRDLAKRRSSEDDD